MPSSRGGQVRTRASYFHAEHAAQRYGVAAQDILRGCGELGLVGGQEDMIIDIAIEMAHQPATV
jgi:hypothetical protein